jgi:hypothetical protein
MDDPPLTAGRFGYSRRRIHRDDFARILGRLVPAEGADRVVPQAEVGRPEVLTAAAHCLHLAARFPGEPLALVAERVAHRLLHPLTQRGGPGELLLYAAALLCRELEALSAIEAAASVHAVLESRSAHDCAEALHLAVSTPLRYTTQSSFDSASVRGGGGRGAAAARGLRRVDLAVGRKGLMGRAEWPDRSG